MRSMYKRPLIVLIGIALLLGIAPLSTSHIARAFDGQTKRIKTPRERLAERSFPNVTLTTHEGKKVRFYDDLLKDKIILINFMYVKCDGICPSTTANLLTVQKMLGDRIGRDIFMYSITLKPEEDTPEVLNRYAKAYKTKPGWLFLTGDPKDVELLRRSLGFIDRDPVRDANKSNHIGMLRFGNEPLTLWAGCPGLLGPGKIVKEIGLVDWPMAEEAKMRKGQMKKNGLTLFAALFAAVITATVALAQGTPAASSAIAVGQGPEGLTSNGTHIFVANQFSNTITRLSASDGALAGTFAAGHCPVALAFDGMYVWVANYLSNNVMKLDPTTGAVIGTFAVGDGPGGLLCANGMVWVANRNSNTITKLRDSDGMTLGTYEVGTRPIGMATDGTYIYVTNNDSDTMTKLRESSGALVGTYKVGDGPFGIAFDGAYVWVANFGDGNVMKMATDGTLIGTYKVGDGPVSAIYKDGIIYVVNNGGDSVTRLRARDGMTLGSFPVGRSPIGVAAAGSNIWVANFGNNTVTKQ